MHLILRPMKRPVKISIHYHRFYLIDLLWCIWNLSICITNVFEAPWSSKKWFPHFSLRCAVSLPGLIWKQNHAEINNRKLITGPQFTMFILFSIFILQNELALFDWTWNLNKGDPINLITILLTKALHHHVQIMIKNSRSFWGKWL